MTSFKSQFEFIDRRRANGLALTLSPKSIGRVLRWFSLLALMAFSSSNAAETKKHMFILSGQSNMTGGLKNGFIQSVEAKYGKENVTIVFHSKSGRGIRFWDKDYRFPDGYKLPGKGTPSARTKKQHGEVYGPLMEKIRAASKGKSHDTITFVWMQGESDGIRGLGDVYEESFLRLLNRIKNDLNRKDISFVIGRINGCRLNGPNADYWKRVRNAQVKLAKEAEFGDWLDTDDLSGPKHGVHFPKESYMKLGTRFAAKAIMLIQKRAANSAKETQGVKSK